MKKPFLIATSLSLVVLIAFVYFAQPIQAKADQPTLDYVETNLSSQEVANLFAIPAAYVPVAIMIIGFIVLTYCTLRNINVPVSYPDNASFFDKCNEIGQYVIDNCTEPIKDFLYSVYIYCEDNNLTSITGIAAFTATHISVFFRAISLWIASSLIENVSPIGEGLLKLFDRVDFHPLLFLQSGSVATHWANDVPSLYNLFYYAHNESSRVTYIEAYKINTNIDLTNKAIVFVNGNVVFYTYNPITTNLDIDTNSNNFIHYWSSYNASSINDPCNTSLTVRTEYSSYAGNNANSSNYFSPSYFSELWQQCISLGLNVYFYTSTPISIPIEDAIPFVDQSIVTPWSDQIYQPADDELELDPDKIGELLGGALGGLTLGELINLLTQGKTLTLDSALDNQQIVGGGDYVFPSMDNIWKYPQYFFDMLHGWGVFVKGCLNAVTVGDGGLSWLFYGGFVLLICGGVIGKILLG